MKVLVSALCAMTFAGSVPAIDLEGLKPIGSVVSFAKTDSGILLSCSDKSEVRIIVLAPDLVRVRVGFGKKLTERDHSWAIAKTQWAPAAWRINKEPAALRLSTAELEVVVRRSPLLIEFKDAKTGRNINSDQRPMLFDSASGTVAAAKKLGFDEHFYGLGEKTARLDKRRGAFVMWNSDTPAYREGTDPLYQSIPFYIGWQDGAGYGIFFDNSYRTRFDFGQSYPDCAVFAADGGEMNYYFFQGPSIKKILGRYADLTGHMPMPPMWALGVQQSRYSYYPDSLVEEVVRRYRADDLPLDVVHLDIHYMNGYRLFTWNRDRFPDPAGFTSRLRKQGVKVVTIVDPGVKQQPPAAGASDPIDHPELASQDKSYYVFNQGTAKDFFLKRKDGRTYVGRVWPGDSVFVDYTIEAAARWWGDLHRAYTDNGVAGIWTDMNEPSDFLDQAGKTQADVITYDQGAYSPYAKNRNLFALNMARATFEGLERLRPNERPYVITRAAYAGIQRYSTMWTGDNVSSWESLALSIPMLMTVGLSGETFAGSDIGGFMGNADGELLVRWYQVGFLTPFCRNHACIDSYDHEPWRFGKQNEDIIRKYLKLRYRLLPYLYTALEESHRTGVPMFRPLLLDYQQDPNTLNIDDEFMVGSGLLAAPVLRPGVNGRRVYLPAGTWYDYWTGERHRGGQTIEVKAPLETAPLFVRGGAILPLGPEMRFVQEKPADPVTFDIYPDESGHAAVSLYEDDGISPAYRNGAFRRTTLEVTKRTQGFEIVLDAPEGKYAPPARQFVFAVRSRPAAGPASVDGKSLRPEAWIKTGGRMGVRIADDGKEHRIVIR